MFALDMMAAEQPLRIWISAAQFRDDVQTVHKFCCEDRNEKPTKLSTKNLEAAQKFFGTRDKHAGIVTNDKGGVVADADLRDSEYVPFSVAGADVAAGVSTYFDAEVRPHWPDAWVNETVRDSHDNQIGVVGCEINFNREFYVYEAPRSREAIRKDIEAMEQKFMEMLKGVAG